MTQHRDVDSNPPEHRTTPTALSANYVDIMRSREGTKGGDRLVAQAGDYITFNEGLAVSSKYGGTDFLTSAPKTGIDQVAFLTPKIQVNTSCRLDGKALT
jgi:hypothetical protein